MTLNMFPIIDWNLISLEVLMAITLVSWWWWILLCLKTFDKDWIGIFSFIALFGLIIFWLTQGASTRGDL